MNRRQHLTERRTQTQKRKQPPTKPGGIPAPPRQSFASWTVSVLVTASVLVGLWSVNTATSTAEEKASPSPVAVTQSVFAPDVASRPLMGTPPLLPHTSFRSNGRRLTVANVERRAVEAEETPELVVPAQPVLEANLSLDLSESNSGRTFDLGRIAPCDQPVFLVSAGKATVGDLKVGDRIRMTGGRIGRVISIAKKWHTPTMPQYDANGNGLNRVIATTKRMTDQILYLHTSAELVKTTPEHPFAVKGKGYVEARRLQSGDVLETQGGKVVTVDRTEVCEEPQLVYNLEVENAHNFFVGKNRMLVHNGGDCIPSFGMHTFDMDSLTAAGGRRGAAGLSGNSGGYLVYVVRDAETGELLKVGQTGNWRTRFPVYRTKAIGEGRTIAIDAFEVDKDTARHLNPNTLEAQMQRNLFGQGHSLPWDNSNLLQRLRGSTP